MTMHLTHAINVLDDDINVNNNVGVEELYNGCSWIHGPSDSKLSDIQITVFVITICGPQLSHCVNSINNLNIDTPILVNVIMNIAPTSKAYNTMVERCTTKYFIQMDEDMELFSNAIEQITANLSLMTRMHYLQYYNLIDNYFGINNPPVLIGLKVYNNDVMCNYHIQNFEQVVSSVDQLWQKQINRDGYKNTHIIKPIGYHARHRAPFDVMLRFCKMTKSILDPRIESHRSDRPKLVRPMNAFESSETFNRLFVSIVSHFVTLNYSLQTFLSNVPTFSKFISYIPANVLAMYEIEPNYIKLSEDNVYGVFDKDCFLKLHEIPFGHNMCNIYNLYGIIGIINTMFDNYQYSYDKYPYSIDAYFKSVFCYKVVFVIDDENNCTKDTLADSQVALNIASNLKHICIKNQIDVSFIQIEFCAPNMCVYPDIDAHLIVNITCDTTIMSSDILCLTVLDYDAILYHIETDNRRILEKNEMG